MSHALKILLLWFKSSQESKKKNMLILLKMFGKRFARQDYGPYHREFL